MQLQCFVTRLGPFPRSLEVTDDRESLSVFCDLALLSVIYVFVTATTNLLHDAREH